MGANPARVVYGAIAVSALLAAESAQRETYLTTVVAVVIGLVLYWIAHSYAEFAARRLTTPGKMTVEGILDTMQHELWLLAGAAVPLVPLLAWWAAGGFLQNAVSAAVWTSAAMIVVIEVVAALRAQLSGRELIGQIALGALLGLLVIALKLVLH
jgi:hypothetical protein